MLPTVSSLVSMSFQVLAGAVCQTVHTPCARSSAPSQLNFSGSKRAPLLPQSGVSGTVELMIPIVPPSCGADA